MIALDPGHGGQNTGALFGRLVEKRLNLDTVNVALDECRMCKLDVVSTRETDIEVGWSARYDAARKAGARGVISIHHNANQDRGIRGAETYHWPTNRLTGDLAGYALALMPGEVFTRKAFPATDEPGPADDWLERPRVVLAAFRELPTLLIEVAYVTNDHDGRLIGTEAFTARVADGIAGTVQRFEEMLDRQEDGHGA